MQIPIEEIPEDFVPLKNYFKLLLDRTSEKFFLVILLGKLLEYSMPLENEEEAELSLFKTTDAIEIFFVNSHQNGATSWIPRDLPKNVKIIITFTSGEHSI